MTEDYKGPGWTRLSDAKPPIGTRCQWVSESYGVHRGVGYWFEQYYPCVLGFSDEHGLYIAPHNLMWWKPEEGPDSSESRAIVHSVRHHPVALSDAELAELTSHPVLFLRHSWTNRYSPHRNCVSVQSVGGQTDD